MMRAVAAWFVLLMQLLVLGLRSAANASFTTGLKSPRRPLTAARAYRSDPWLSTPVALLFACPPDIKPLYNWVGILLDRYTIRQLCYAMGILLDMYTIR